MSAAGDGKVMPGRATSATPQRRLAQGWRLTSAPGRMLPTFLIIGAQRSGTTSLHHYLVEHPQIGAPFRKEVHYFDLKAGRSTLWYRSFFPLKGTVAHSLDSSPYYLFHPAVPERVFRTMPQVKLIVLLRDPVQRTFSHYQHSRAHGLEKLEFAEALAREDERLAGVTDASLAAPEARSRAHQNHSYVTRSLYAPQIERWYRHFPSEQMLILQAEQMFSDPATVVGRVQEWLGVQVDVPSSLQPMNTRAYDPLDDELRATLVPRFAADRAALEQLTGQTFDWS